MDAKEEAVTGKGCCEKSNCCGCKALIAAALLAVGAIGGYLAGKCCAHKACPVSGMPVIQTPAK